MYIHVICYLPQLPLYPIPLPHIMFVVGVEAAGKAWKSIATRHDLLAVKEKERETKGKRGGKGRGGASSTDGSGNAFTQARQVMTSIVITIINVLLYTV